MTEAYVGAYWGPRSDDVPTVAERVRQTIAAIERATRTATWFLPADSEVVARAQPVQPDDVARLLAESAEAGPVAGSGTWLHLSLWDGGEVGVSVHAGMTSPRVTNTVVVRFALADGAPGPAWFDLLRVVVAAWKPDWATLSSTELREAQEPDLDRVVAGWATYLGPARPVPTALPAGVLTEPCWPGRLLRFTDPTSVDADAVRALRHSLRRPPGGGHRHEVASPSPPAARRSRQRQLVLGAVAAFLVAAGLILRTDHSVGTVAVLVLAVAAPLTYPFLLNLRRPRTRSAGQQRWRTLVAYGEMAAASPAVPVTRERPRSTGEAFGRLSRSTEGWQWEPDPRSTRIGFGPIALPASWEVVDQGRVRSGVFTSHVTVGSADDPRTVTFWCTATTAAEVVAAC